MSKGIVYLNISRLGRVIEIWEEVFCKLRVTFDVLVNRNKFFLESSDGIKAHLDVVVEVLKVQISVSFEFYLDEEFI